MHSPIAAGLLDDKLAFTRCLEDDVVPGFDTEIDPSTDSESFLLERRSECMTRIRMSLRQ